MSLSKKNKQHCALHGGSKLCVSCRLFKFHPKYDKHCTDCFINCFPEDPRSAKGTRQKRRETVVCEAIDAACEGFIHDKAMYTGGCCSHRRRIDHRVMVQGTMLAIETDENAHVGYDKEDEVVRYDDLFMAYSCKFVFIRFNCDANREKGEAKTSFERKLEVLMECIGAQMCRIEAGENTELVEISKLFY